MDAYNNGMNNGMMEGHELGWDDTIQEESEFIILPAGDYDFTVKSYERGRFNGSEKMSACMEALGF